MSAPTQLALIPRDGLFCKDGRGWHTSSSGRGHALDWPWPSTVLGALRSAWGRQSEAHLGRCFTASDWAAQTAGVSLGSCLALRRPMHANWSSSHRVWPVAGDALWLEDQSEVFRLDPVARRLPTLGIDDDEARESLWVPTVGERAKPLRGPRWWSDRQMIAWLLGIPLSADTSKSIRTTRRIQAHVGIQASTLTTDQGVLFSHDVVETVEHDAEWALGAEVEGLAGATLLTANLGSDGRPARVEPLPQDIFALPSELSQAFRKGSQGLRLLVISPACFSAGWIPDGFEKVGNTYQGQLPGCGAPLILRAAIVGRPVHLSGWDMAANDGRGAPKPVARMVPPGAIYFFERVDGLPFGEGEARAFWLGALGSRAAEGFGRVVPGLWTPNRSKQ